MSENFPDPIQFHGGRVRLFHGDARAVLRGMDDNSVDSVVCDPPYALESIKKRFGKSKSNLEEPLNRTLNTKAGQYRRVARGFMGCKWDSGDTAFDPEFWAEVLRVLKPGGHLCAFGGTRTSHRLVCAIEDAGFEIRDQLIWAYGQGFAKKGYIFKDIDKAAGVESEASGFSRSKRLCMSGDFTGTGYFVSAPVTASAKEWKGWAGQLKPAIEPICMARKPLSEKTVAANVLRWSVSALNIDGCRVGTREANKTVSTGEVISGNVAMSGGNYVRRETDEITIGRWPANIVHDGSEEVLACFQDDAGGGYGKRGSNRNSTSYGIPDGTMETVGFGDSGSAARFFASFPLTEDDRRIWYDSKADFYDRAGSSHPCVKPIALLRWLSRLITPPGGTILDPFSGTGTVGEAAFYEGFKAILIEREDTYIADIKRRMELMTCGPAERSRESIKASGLVADPGPLFGGGEPMKKGREIGPTGFKR